MATSEEVKNYYDSFNEHQRELGINVRHRTIFKNLKKAGLKPGSNVLEIGCGIGTVSHLILRYLKRGSYVGVDISPDNIRTAKIKNSFHKNAEFFVDDMSNFVSSRKFDFIVFPDVLEHIPVEQHKRIFESISTVSTDNVTVVINIPEPYTLDWHRRNNSGALQIIDQSLSMKDLCNDCYPFGFYLYSMVPYGLQYQHEEYLSIILKKDFVRETIVTKSKFQLGLQNYKAKVGS